MFEFNSYADIPMKFLKKIADGGGGRNRKEPRSV